MEFQILADENIDCRIIRKLRNKGFDVISVFETSRGIGDKEVIKLAKEHTLFVTEKNIFL